MKTIDVVQGCCRAAICAAILLALLALPAPVGAVNKGYYSSDSKPKDAAKKTGKQWMKTLGGAKKLSELTLPGTHDTCALHGGDLVKCQAWSVKDQLEAGIRFLDIRCRHFNDVFTIHHGIVYQKINFGKVRDQCETFLKDNPSECVVMSVKEEHTAAGNKKTFAEVFAGYLKGHEKYWYTKGTIPTLKEARGKIVLVARKGGIGGIAWGDMNVQDDYDVPTVFAISKKWDKVKKQLEEAKKGAKSTWYINFCSGSSAGAYPYTIALKVNDNLHKYLAKASGRFGTILLDFPGEKLIERIIKLNK